MKKFILIFFVLVIFAAISINAQSAAANKDWPAFWTKFRSAVIRKDKATILGLAIDDSRFERDAGGDSPSDYLDFWLSSRMYKKTAAEINSGVKPWQGGKITRKGCYWFKFIGGRWYWAGIPCD